MEGTRQSGEKRRDEPNAGDGWSVPDGATGRDDGETVATHNGAVSPFLCNGDDGHRCDFTTDVCGSRSPRGAAEWKQTLTTHTAGPTGALATLLRIWPDVDTFRMSFCGVPGSCSGSLSDDSSKHRAAVDSGPPASAILPSDPRREQEGARRPAARIAQHNGDDRRLPPPGGRTAALPFSDINFRTE